MNYVYTCRFADWNTRRPRVDSAIPIFFVIFFLFRFIFLQLVEIKKNNDGLCVIDGEIVTLECEPTRNAPYS